MTNYERSVMGEEWHARALCRELHKGIKRKDGFTPYENHLFSVADRVISIGCTDVIVICAIYLHDSIEDTPITPQELYGRLVKWYSHSDAAAIVKLVLEVTDLNKQGYPQKGLNRKKRKEVTNATFLYASPEACIIKLYDRIDNLSTIDDVQGEKDFAVLYKQESVKLLGTIEYRLEQFKETPLISKALIDLKATCRSIR